MNFAAKTTATACAAITIIGLSACATVDLSQVSMEQQAETTVQTSLNVVERSSVKLTSFFTQKGWCKSGPKERTMSAANVLLNGISEADTEKPQTQIKSVNFAQLSTDIDTANQQVLQTTKAAEIYLATAEASATLDNELSLLEAALLSAREAESHFGGLMKRGSSGDNRQKYEALHVSVGTLKTITDSYGQRIRSNIASIGSASRS